MEHKTGRDRLFSGKICAASFRQDAVFFLLLMLAAVFFCWRCRYGFADWDESFYLTIPRRLTQGDRLLIHEWHVSQLSGVLLYLPVLLFEKLTGGTDGIYLAFRYLCVAVQTLTAAAVYLRLRRYHRIGAAAGALALAVYTPFGINALSYNSMGVLFMTLTGALLAPAERNDRAVYVLAGLCFAGAVLCCPHLALVYLLYAAVVILRRKKEYALPAFSPRAFGLFTLGAAVLAVYFFAVGLAGAELSELPEALRGIFSDPEHREQSSLLFPLLRVAAEYPIRIVYACPSGGICLCLVVLLAGAARLDNRREEHAGVYFLAGAVLTAAAEVLFFAFVRYINFMMLAVNVIALLCFALAPPAPSSDPLRRLGLLWWLPGFLYSWLAAVASNQTGYIIFSAAASVVPCSAVVILLTARAVLPKRAPLARYAAAALAVLAALQIGGTAFLRYWNVFWGDDIRYQTETIAEGTHRGLVVEPYRVGQLASSERVMQELERRAAGEPVLPLTVETWVFMGDYRNGAYSAWLSGVDDVTLDRLEAYFALNPEKLPAAAWTASENAGFAGRFCTRFGYTAEETPGGIFLMPENS